jgi:hypothetical protein
VGVVVLQVSLDRMLLAAVLLLSESRLDATDEKFLISLGRFIVETPTPKCMQRLEVLLTKRSDQLSKLQLP